MTEPYLIERFLYSRTPSDHFYCVAYDISHRVEKSIQYRDHDVDGEPIIVEACSVADIKPSLISPGSIQTSRICRQGSVLSTPPQSCPSLVSTDSRDGLDASNASPAPRGASIGAGGHGSTRPPTPSQRPDLPIITSIRQVLSSDPIYAQDVISAVDQLPHEKRNLLFESGTEPVDQSESPTSSEESTKKRTRSSSKSNGSGDDRPTGGAAGGGQDGGDNDNGQGKDEAAGQGGHPPPSKKPNKDKNRRWICPYCLAYSDILQTSPAFSRCLSRNLTEVHLWRQAYAGCRHTKDHLKKHHSPNARNADLQATVNARFYMDSGQWEAVLAKIKGWKGRPRSLDMWLSHWRGLFLEVWRIIFPPDQFPGFREPHSPFHLDSDEVTNLTRQATTLLEPIYNARAARAVRNDAVASRESFRPSEAEIKDMMSEAIAIAMLNSPGAVGATQWLAHASPQMLPAAAADDTSAPRSETVTTPHGVPSETNSHTSTLEPDPGTVSTASASSSIDTSATQTALPTLPAVHLALFTNGTRVTIDLLPANTSYPLIDDQTGQLQLDLPEPFHMINLSQVPLFPPPSMPLAMTAPHTPASVTQPAVDFGSDIDWQPSTQPLGAQGIAMPVIEGKQLSTEESAILSAFGSILP